MNPIKASRNTQKHPLMARLAKWFGSHKVSAISQGKRYILSTYNGKDYLVGIKTL